jgi:hypothetical protein
MLFWMIFMTIWDFKTTSHLKRYDHYSQIQQTT